MISINTAVGLIVIFVTFFLVISFVEEQKEVTAKDLFISGFFIAYFLISLILMANLVGDIIMSNISH